MSIYAIMGATGQVGGAVARQLLRRGAAVRAIVRSEAAAIAWRARGADAVLASLDDGAALTRAFAGADGVFVATPTFFESDDMFAANRVATRNLGAALRAASPGKVVLLSSVGAQFADGTGAIGKLYILEQAFADLPALTSIRAAWFMENYAGLLETARKSGTLPSMLAPLGRAIPMVATADIGAVAAGRLLAEWRGQHIVELEGPRSYSPLDVAAALGRVLQRPVSALALQRGEWLAAFRAWGLTADACAQMAAMVEGFNNQHIRFSDDTTLRQRGGTTLDDVLTDLARR